MSNKFIPMVLFSKPFNRNQRRDFTLLFTFHRGRYIQTRKSPPLFKAIFGYLTLLTLIKLHQTQQPQQTKLMSNQRQLIADSIFFKLCHFRVCICTHTWGKATSLPHGGYFAFSLYWNPLTLEGARSRKSSSLHQLCFPCVLYAAPWHCQAQNRN